MLRFFRSIRKNLLREGKVSRYLGYAIGEILLIMIGIFLALQLNNWNEARKDLAEETQILLQLKTEFEMNKAGLENITDIYREVSSDMKAFLEIIEPEPKSYPDDQIFEYLSSLRISRPYNPDNGVVTSLINSGKISLISHAILSNMLNRWPKHAVNIDGIISKMIVQIGRYPTESVLYRKRDVTLGASEGSAVGSSRFPFDQKKLLSSPVTEDMAETKLEYADLLIQNFERIIRTNQNVLRIIDVQLAERGIEED